MVAVAGHDPLKTERLAYADALTRVGVPVTLRRYPDIFHPFLGFFAKPDAARGANDRICTAAARLLGSGALAML